jgi:large subunit ribosomal protein L25
MEKRQELKVKTRDTLGKKVRALRRLGLTPANLYGPGISSIALQVETPILEHLIAGVGRNALVMLRIDDARKLTLAMIRDIQRDALNDALLHVGFFQVEATHKVRTEVPLLFSGDAPASRSKGTMLIQYLTSLHVEGLPADLPRSIEVDLSPLVEMGQAIHVSDIAVADGLEILNDPDQIVAHIESTRVPVEEVEAAAEAEGLPAEAEEE